MEGEAVRCYTGNVPMRHAFCTRARCGVRELRAGVDPLKILKILKMPNAFMSHDVAGTLATPPLEAPLLRLLARVPAPGAGRWVCYQICTFGITPIFLVYLDLHRYIPLNILYS